MLSGRNISWILPAMVVCSPAVATEYLSFEQAKRILFPSAERFVDVSLDLSDGEVTEIEKLSGHRQRWKKISAWRAEVQGKVLGMALLDEVVGKHEFITYAVGVDVDHAVVGVEILAYRETYGYQIRAEQWRARFAGRRLDDPLRLDVDIPNIAGATLSCRNVTNGVKRMLALSAVLKRRLQSR